MTGYFAHGIQGVTIDGDRVEMDRLVAAWRSRGDVDKVRVERDASITHVNTLRDTLRESTKANTELIRERDEARAEAADLRERFEGMVRLRDQAVRSFTRLRQFTDAPLADTPVGRKRLWLVRRTDAAGKPGEYGKVIVWAADEVDAVDVVMWSGYNGGPLYGYRDRDHTVVYEVEYGDEADDQVVVAETLR